MYHKRKHPPKIVVTQKELSLFTKTFDEITSSKIDKKKSTNFVKFKLNKLIQLDKDLAVSPKSKNKKKELITNKKILEDAIASYFGDGMMVIDYNKNIILINKSGKDILGYNSKITFHRKPYDKYLKFFDKNGKCIDQLCDPVNYSVKSGREVALDFSDEFYCQKKNGKLFPATMSISPLFVDKKIKATVIRFRDATKEKYFDEIKSDFVSIAAHQIRTPLSISKLNTDLLLSSKEKISQNQKKLLNEINFANRKIGELLNNFLLASKVELGLLEVNKEPTDVSIIIEDVLRELKIKISQKKIDINTNYGKSFKLKTDSSLLRVALQDLISNAVKYTSINGKIDISLSKNKKDVLIKIKDNGCGILKKDQSRVFLKLYRGLNAKKISPDGSGLGLYIAKSIIENCDGLVWFKSKEGKGTTFYLSLPRSSELHN